MKDCGFYPPSVEILNSKQYLVLFIAIRFSREANTSVFVGDNVAEAAEALHHFGIPSDAVWIYELSERSRRLCVT